MLFEFSSSASSFISLFRKTDNTVLTITTPPKIASSSKVGSTTVFSMSVQLEILIPIRGNAEISSQRPDIIDGIGSVDPFEFVTEKSDESYEYSIGYNQ